MSMIIVYKYNCNNNIAHSSLFWTQGVKANFKTETSIFWKNSEIFSKILNDKRGQPTKIKVDTVGAKKVLSYSITHNFTLNLNVQNRVTCLLNSICSSLND